MARKCPRNSPRVIPQVLWSQAALHLLRFGHFLCLFIVLCLEMFCCNGGREGRKLVAMRLLPLGGTRTTQGIVNSQMVSPEFETYSQGEAGIQPLAKFTSTLTSPRISLCFWNGQSRHPWNHISWPQNSHLLIKKGKCKVMYILTHSLRFVKMERGLNPLFISLQGLHILRLHRTDYLLNI